jgi:hypothetical protein
VNIEGMGINQTILSIISIIQLREHITGNGKKYESSFPPLLVILHSLLSGADYDDPDAERNNTDNFVPFVADSKSTKVWTVNDRIGSQEPIEPDAAAQAATLSASYNEISVEYIDCHICHKKLDDWPVS